MRAQHALVRLVISTDISGVSVTATWSPLSYRGDRPVPNHAAVILYFLYYWSSMSHLLSGDCPLVVYQVIHTSTYMASDKENIIRTSKDIRKCRPVYKKSRFSSHLKVVFRR